MDKDSRKGESSDHNSVKKVNSFKNARPSNITTNSAVKLAAVDTAKKSVPAIKEEAENSTSKIKFPLKGSDLKNLP
jgi:dual specificity tyrosine-phosphorylation-regulated kinase 2/3/4